MILRAILVFLYLTEAIKAYSDLCPIGYKFATKTQESTSFCYKIKEPEAFEDKFKGCVGNLFTKSLIKSSNASIPIRIYWDNYVSAYPGGPLIDWDLDEDDNENAKILEVTDMSPTALNKELCTVFDSADMQVNTVDCSKKFPRLCIVRPYTLQTDGSCSYPYITIRDPTPVCIRTIQGTDATGKEIIDPRATWQTAESICRKKSGDLPHSGWIYANHPQLKKNSNEVIDIPIGIVRSGHELKMTDASKTIVPRGEWHFPNGTSLRNMSGNYVALRGEFWYFVDNKTTFFHVLCEQPVILPSLQMDIKENKQQLHLYVSGVGSSPPLITCYTDSEFSYPTKVEISNENDYYILKSTSDGYYWCFNGDTLNYNPSQSNKVLYIKDKETLNNLYSIKINHINKVETTDLHNVTSEVKRKLSEYFYLTTKYMNKHKRYTFTESDILKFKNEFVADEVVINIKLKRVYVDHHTLLFHIDVNDTYASTTLGTHDGLKITSIRPTYFCPALAEVEKSELGQHVEAIDCRTYNCIGNFNDGVQWIESKTDDCVSVVNSSTSMAIRNTGNQNDSSDSDEESEPTIPLQIHTTPSTTRTTTPPATPPTPPPLENVTVAQPEDTEEVIQNLVESLESVIYNDSVPVTMDFLNITVFELNTVLTSGSNVDVPGRLLYLVEEALVRVELGSDTSTQIVSPSLALAVSDALPLGLVLTTADSPNANDELHFLTSVSDLDVINRTRSEVEVELPPSAVQTTEDRRASFIVFRDETAFTQSANATSNATVNSRILSVTVTNLTLLPVNEYIDIRFLSNEQVVPEGYEKQCAYWDYDGVGSGQWSTNGCELIEASDGYGLDTCRCTHLTHFAQIIAPRTDFDSSNSNALSIISLIGVIFSLFGLTIIALTGIIFKSWRRDFGNKIWLQLSLSILILSVLFLILSFVDFDEYGTWCVIVGVLLHYSVLNSFCWMVVSAVLSYRRLVLVFTRDASHKLLRASAFAYGVPFIIISILFAINPSAYRHKFAESDNSFCYPSGLSYWLTVFMPVAVALIVNIILFSLILRAVYSSKQVKPHGKSGDAFRNASVSFLLVFLFGLPWVFGLFSYILAFAYIFAIMASLQGLVLFTFFVLGNKKTRDLWLNFLRIKRKGKVPVTSSSYRSGAAHGSSSGGAAVVSGTVTTLSTATPRSLTARDDTRFS